MTDTTFDDLLDIRRGGESLKMGGGPSTVARIRSTGEWQEKAEALREIFRQTLGTIPDIQCPLGPDWAEETDCGTYVKRVVTYNVEPDERIAAYVLVPKNRPGLLPAVLCIHPTTPLGREQTVGNDPAPAGKDRAYGLHLVERGYVTIAYDLLSANQRCYPGLRDFDTGPFYSKHPNWSVRGKDLWDLGRTIDLLETVPEVDVDRIGSIGHSQGGGITVHAMALDPRLKAGVSSCGVWPYRYSKNPYNNARTGWWVGRPFLRPYCLTGKSFPIDLHEYLALAAPRAILNISAVNDFQYALDEEPQVRAVWARMVEAADSVYRLVGAAGRFRNVLHTSGHGFEERQREVAYSFLDEMLKG